jgi:hypothetical protein
MRHTSRSLLAKMEPQGNKVPFNLVDGGTSTTACQPPQDSAPVLTQSPNWEDVPVLGVTDHAVLVEHSYDLLC